LTISGSLIREAAPESYSACEFTPAASWPTTAASGGASAGRAGFANVTWPDTVYFSAER